MIQKVFGSLLLCCFIGIAGVEAPCLAKDVSPLKLDQRPTRPGEWGYRPSDQAELELDPPGFVWRPQKNIVQWELEVGRLGAEQAGAGQGSSIEATLKAPAYHGEGMEYSAHCPSRTFGPGQYVWRYRGFNAEGKATEWSQIRRFTILPDAVAFPIPSKDELLAKIPKSHPRLFVRPEQMERLREECKTKRKGDYDSLIADCEKILKNLPSTEEPPKYPDEIVRLSEEWRAIWWGNRIKTENALVPASTLAIGWALSGKKEYGEAAKQILMETAKWDPKGATGYRYNDEAGMPFAYHFSRTYTFVYELLTEEEREVCRRVMRARGEEIYRHLRGDGHLWCPYNSHSNRAWHYLGEVGVAFHGEIPEADDWVWYAMHVFRNSYPVWCDSDGGWHEGLLYWASYMHRFTWWGDVMRVALGVDAYKKPYFSQIGYFPMYVAPPGKLGAGFGDLNGNRHSKQLINTVYPHALQAQNGHWLWYVDQHLADLSPEKREEAYRRYTIPVASRFCDRPPVNEIKRIPPTDLPTSRLFRGIGQAALNTTIVDAKDDVQVLFKSAPVPFGSYSHGYESSNSFLLWAYGKQLFIRSGYRDIYGSDHHKNWMWSTRSVNNITVDGQGQASHAGWTGGEITAFETTPWCDVVVGSAADAYRGSPKESSLLDRYTRTIVFVKPELVVVYDQLEAKKPSTFNYWLHTLEPLAIDTEDGKQNLELKIGDVGCSVQMLRPTGLKFTQTDKCDPPPRERVKLRQFHLVADTLEKQKATEFITLCRPHRLEKPGPRGATLTEEGTCYRLKAETIDGPVEIRLPKQGASDGTVVIEKDDKQLKLKVSDRS